MRAQRSRSTLTAGCVSADAGKCCGVQARAGKLSEEHLREQLSEQPGELGVLLLRHRRQVVHHCAAPSRAWVSGMQQERSRNSSAGRSIDIGALGQGPTASDC